MDFLPTIRYFLYNFHTFSIHKKTTLEIISDILQI